MYLITVQFYERVDKKKGVHFPGLFLEGKGRVGGKGGVAHATKMR